MKKFSKIQLMGYLISLAPFVANAAAGVKKIIEHDKITSKFDRLEIDHSFLMVAGIVQLVAAILYLIPRASIFGAVLLTSVMGAACMFEIIFAKHHNITAIALTGLIWIGLVLRNYKKENLLNLY